MKDNFLKNNSELVDDFLKKEVYKYLKKRSLGLQYNIPIKLQYLGKGAKKWQALTVNKKYISINETRLLSSVSISKITNSFKNYKSICVIDLGCGTGEKASIILKKLINSSDFYSIKYLPIDISKELLDITIEKCKIPGVSIIQGKILDYENDVLNLEQNMETPKLILFLGNNLGNVEDYSGMLKKINANMRPSKDLLLIGIELAPDNNKDWDDIVKSYSSVPVTKFLSTALEPFGIFPNQTHKRKGSGNNQVSISNDTVHISFKFTKDKDVFLKENVGVINFSAKEAGNNKIHLAQSLRFRIVNLKMILNKNNLESINVWQSNNKFSALILCKKTQQ